MKATVLFAFLALCMTCISQSFELVERIHIDNVDFELTELKFPITDMLIVDSDCGDLEDDTIIIKGFETLESYSVWELRNPGLKGVDKVIMIEFEWVGCCSYIESHYFLSTDTCSFIKLDVIENEACDYNEDKLVYVFPAMAFGEPGSIKKLLTSYNLEHVISDTSDVEYVSSVGKYDYNYDSSYVLTGTLKLESYYGPPGYGADPDFDDEFQSWVLYLDKPISVYEFDPKESINYTVEDVNVVQINKRKVHLKPFEGQKVKLKGIFYSPHTGYHQEPLLMDLEEITK